MGDNTRRLRQEARLCSKLKEFLRRGQSQWCETRESGIHGSGMHATRKIPKGTRIIEYIGEPVSKAESDRRGIARMEEASHDGGGAVYIFTLNGKWDLDGNVPWNQSRLMNHSCEPNCEAVLDEDEDKIFIHALRDIAKGEELTYDYGFDVELYQDHPCRCGKPGCVGYIVSRSQWPKLLKLLAEEEGKQAAKPKARRKRVRTTS